MTRTDLQNKSLHKYFDMLASQLNEEGLDMRKVLKPAINIPWTKESVKKHLWKPIQDAMYEKRSTTQLERIEVTEVYDVLNRHLGERFGVHVPFPSKEQQ